MADNINIKDFAGSSQTVLADSVEDGVMGSGYAQVVKIMDGTLGSTNKLVIDSTGAVLQKEIPDATAASNPSNATSTEYESSHVIKSGPGTLYAITGYNSSSVGQFIQVHNSTSLPGDSALPSVMFYVYPQSNFSYSADKFGRFFSTGIVVCNSSTGPTKTLGGNDCWFDCQFK